MIIFDYKSFGNVVSFKRKQAGLTQEQLSEKMNISAVYISYIENGNRKISLEMILRLINTLQITDICRFFKDV